VAESGSPSAGGEGYRPTVTVQVRKPSDVGECCLSVRQSDCLSRRSTTAAAAGGFAAEVRRTPAAADIDR